MESKHSSHQLLLNFVVPPEISKFAEIKNMEVNRGLKQRILRHKPNPGIAVPPKEHEMFIGGLPPNCLEPMIVPLLESFGDIYEFRMMLNSNGSNRSHAFVRFYNQKDANNARVLNNFEIQPGHRIRVFPSIENSRLVLIGVPFYKTAREIFEELYPMFPGLKSIGVADGEGTHFGPPVVAVYLNHKSASMAISKMVSNPLHLWGYRVHVDWASQKTVTSPLNFKCTKVLQVRGISSDTTNRKLAKIFGERSNKGVQHVLRYQEREAFIFFKSRGKAEMAKKGIQGTIINGNEIHVEVFSPTITNEELNPEGSLLDNNDQQALDTAQPVGEEAEGPVEQHFS